MKAMLDLFSRHRERATGIWTLGSDPQRTIFLERGQVIFAQSSHPLDKLTTLLVERGKLTQAQLDYALQNLQAGLSIGRNLIDMGFITQRDLLDVAKAQVERVIWGAMGNLEEEPRFQDRDTDASVVRLSLDTPLLLLVGVLQLRDREKLLELLGPLEQRVALTGPLPELGLPPDLSRLPALLDGSRTLLELSREASAEPMRVGALALYLREMGLARLDPAIQGPPPEPSGPRPILELPPVLPPMEPEPATPPLIASIEAAQRPTMNLEHLAGALDALDEPEALDPQAELPPPITLGPPPEPMLRISAEASGRVEVPEPEEAAEGRSRRGWIWALLLLLAGGGAFLGWRWTRSTPAAPIAPHSEVVTQKPEPPKIDPVKAETPNPLPPKADPPKAAAEPPATQDPDAEARVQAIRKGDWTQAATLGARHRQALPPAAWTLRLEVACQPDTIAHAAASFQGSPDLFLVPIAMKDGRHCTQIFLGHFSSQEEAAKAIAGLPALFQEPGAKPKPFKVSDIPDKQ